MPGSPPQHSEWIDGFLFVGNHLALNFLNTRPLLEDGPRELLPNARAFARWLVAAGLVASACASSTMRAWRDTPGANRFVKDLRALRERFRAAVLKIESGSPPPDSFIREANRLLAKYPRRSILVQHGRSLRREYAFELDDPEAFLALIAEAVASLLAETDHSRLRKCPACIVHFLDTSKKGSRRWCSMNLCGNRAKVAAYQQSKRNSR